MQGIKFMKNFILILALIFSAGVSAQETGVLTGTIKDQEVFDEGVVFASVRLVETELKTQTNFRGNFELKGVHPGKYTLEVTYAGYETLEMPVEIKEGEVTRISSGMAARRLSLDELSTAMSATSKETDKAIGSEKRK